MYIYSFIYIDLYICVCTLRERERDIYRERERPSALAAPFGGLSAVLVAPCFHIANPFEVACGDSDLCLCCHCVVTAIDSSSPGG